MGKEELWEYQRSKLSYSNMQMVLLTYEFQNGQIYSHKPCPVCNDHFTFYTIEITTVYLQIAVIVEPFIDFMMGIDIYLKKEAIMTIMELAGRINSYEEVSGQRSEDNQLRSQGVKVEDPMLKSSELIPFNAVATEPNIKVPLSAPSDFTLLIQKTHTLVSQTDYFYRRGLTAKTIEKYLLGYHPDGFNFAIRKSEQLEEKQNDLMEAYKYYLPVWEANGVCSYFITSVDEGTVSGLPNDYEKTHNPKGLKVKLFNDRYLKGFEIQGDCIYIVEGIFDALSLEELDFPAIALNSVANANLLIESLRNAPELLKSKDFILVPDNDLNGRTLQASLKEAFKKLEVELQVITIPEGYQDFNEFLVASREGAKKYIQKNQNILQHNDFVIDHIDDFHQEVALAGDYKVMKTGFKGIDEILGGGLYPGLIVLGAVPSLGKTTLALQIADNVALKGDDVLFFSLEMRSKDIISRSLSRELYCHNPRTKYSSKEIGYNKCPLEVLNKGTETYYREIAINIAVAEGTFGLGVKEIRTKVANNIRRRGKKPLVVVDYLQILKSMKQSDKQACDENVSALKRISQEFNVPIIVISSLNRSSYTVPISFESFKESGSIEFTADVVIGMQLKGMEEVNSIKTDVGKRELLDKKKSQNPRKIELIILKHRDGEMNGSTFYDYFTSESFFKEVSK